MIKQYYGCIYKVTNLTNSKMYIGRTIRGLEKRKSIHITESKKNNPKCYFHRALKSYGLENFKWEIIQICDSKDELIEAEIRHIKELRTKCPYGYNLSFGGEGKAPIKRNLKPKYKKKAQEDWQHKKRPVYCKELNQTFKSIAEAAEKLGVCKVGIGQAASGKIKKTRKLSFSYAD